MDPGYRYAYLHGFASGPRSRKGLALRARFAEAGQRLELPDLNRPSFAQLSHAAMLAHLDAFDAEGSDRRPWRLIGSSLGGWVAARWAELRPERVDRLLLLCPGFGLAERWPTLLGEEAMERWRRDGAYPMRDGAGVEVPVHYAFYEEACAEVAAPAPACPIQIIHGKRDEVVPIASSREYVEAHPQASLVEVDDDHSLMASLPAIVAEVERHFSIPTAAPDL